MASSVNSAGNRIELPAAIVEGDGDFEVLFVPEAVGAFLDRLGLGVEAFTHALVIGCMPEEPEKEE